ncbi:hypothetical protein HDV03_003929 [Kappamyces sp. JEL0829]|nr:hypothetical protein HDV03_003929 [Kappamyces sp. JEL0829]
MSRKLPTTCKYFLLGRCFRGSSCFYDHGNDQTKWALESPASDLAVADPAGLGPAQKTVDNPLVSLRSDANPPRDKLQLECSVCYESDISVFGLLTSCNHVFCISCVKSWRSQSKHSNTKACPLCRVPSEFYVPVSQTTLATLLSLPSTPQPDPAAVGNRHGCWSGDGAPAQSPASPQDACKQRLIASYLAKRSKIPCRFISKPPPEWNYCSFGSRCHFNHCDPQGIPIPVRRPPRLLPMYVYDMAAEHALQPLGELPGQLLAGVWIVGFEDGMAAGASLILFGSSRANSTADSHGV